MTFTKSRNLPSGVGVYLGMALHHRVPPPYFLEGRARDCAVVVLSRVKFQRAGALSTSRSGQYQALAICSRGVNYGVGVGAAFLCYFRVEQPAIATKTNLWPRIFDALCHEAIHVSTTQPDSAIPLPPSILLAAQRHSWAGLSGLPALRDRV